MRKPPSSKVSISSRSATDDAGVNSTRSPLESIKIGRLLCVRVGRLHCVFKAFTSFASLSTHFNLFSSPGQTALLDLIAGSKNIELIGFQTMGLFSRLRSSSNATATKTTTRPSTPSPVSPFPDQALSSPSANFSPPTPQFDQDFGRRPSLPGPSPSVSSVSFKFSRWRNGKGKGKEDHGKAYEAMAPLSLNDSPSNGYHADSRGRDRVGEGRKRVTMLHAPSNPSLPHVSPRATDGRPGLSGSLSMVDMLQDNNGLRQRRVSSGEWKQDGGILGRLNFEFAGEGEGDRVSSAEAVDASPPIGSLEKHGHENVEDVSLYGSVSSVVLVDNKNFSSGATEQNTGKGRPEEVEQLASPYKARFWKGKARARRPSKTMSEVDFERVSEWLASVSAIRCSRHQSPSPTPRKTAATMPTVEVPTPTRASTAAQADLHQPRPQQLRRPSSSLFKKPFPRSASRASLALDLELPPIDDGSFQLKGFRHISGASDAEGPGELSGYFSHVKREPATDLDRPLAVTASNPPPAFPSPTSHHENLSSPRAPSRPVISRPPSVAPSLSSLDGQITSAPRVSVAAFRKGLRQPSEGQIAVKSDLGHGAVDDDDLPLGMIPRPFERQKSSQSLSSLREMKMGPPATTSSPPSESVDPSRKSSPASANDGVFMVHRNEGGSGGFVVKSGRTTKTAGLEELLQPKAHFSTLRAHSEAENLPAFVTPTPSRSASPVYLPNILPEELVPSPSMISPNGEIINIPRSLSAWERPLRNPSPEQRLSEQLEPPRSSPSPPAQSSRPPPSVHSLRLPTPLNPPLDVADDEVPSLPLPPDQMPPTPPAHTSDLSAPAARALSPLSKLRRASLLEDPMRVIAGLWASPADADDGFDPALVVSSLHAFGDISSPPAPLPKPFEPDQVSSKSTLFDASAAVSSDETPASRSNLQARLAAIASDTALRPLLVPLNTGAPSLESDTAEKLKSPVSDRTASPIVAQPVSNYARVHRLKARSSSNLIKAGPSNARGRKTSWSSSESDTESDRVGRSNRSPQKPRGPRKISTKIALKPVHVANHSVTDVSQPDSSASDGEGSSSEDETLATVKARASKSSLSLPSAVASHTRIQSQSSSATIGGVSKSAPQAPVVLAAPLPTPSTSSSSSTKAAADTSTMPHSSNVLPSFQRDDIHRRDLLFEESPASSQSGLTGESSTILPLTPRDPSIGPTKGVHSRGGSKDLDGGAPLQHVRPEQTSAAR